MAKSSTWIKGAAAVGLVAFGLSQCEGDDPYPDIAVAFNTHGHANAARHMDISQARKNAMALCNSTRRPGCNIKFIFEGTAAYCVNAGMYISEQGQMSFIARPYTRGENPNVALDECNQNDRNVCIPQHFIQLCNTGPNNG